MARGASLFVEELFETADPRFHDELLACTDRPFLKAFSTRLATDQRGFARAAMLRYIDDGCDRLFQRVLVKKLFKHAEEKADHEAMAHFLVAFDRLLQRRLKKRTEWNWKEKRQVTFEVLRHSKDIVGRLPPGDVRKRSHRNPNTGAWVHVDHSKDPSYQRFSLVTRRHLFRRVFRHFRQLGRRDPEAYAKWMSTALGMYTDPNVDSPVKLLDSWSLLHALYWGSGALERKPGGVRLASGARLSSITPAPIHPEIWLARSLLVLGLASTAKSHVVRAWCVAWLRGDGNEGLKGLEIGQIRALLASSDEGVRALGVELLDGAAGVEKLPLVEWLALLRIDDPVVSPMIARLVEKHVAPTRLSLEDCILLACSRAASVAALGWKWALGKRADTQADFDLLFSAANAEAPSVRAQIAPHLLKLVEESKLAAPRHLRDLLDARHDDVRALAVAELVKGGRFSDNTAIWSALSETPYPDTRAHFVKHLESRAKQLSPESLRFVWASTLLAIDRGGRAKTIALNQIAVRVAREPALAKELLPLVDVALRSVRVEERRSALSALARAATSDPAFASALATFVPGVRLGDQVSA